MHLPIKLPILILLLLPTLQSPAAPATLPSGIDTLSLPLDQFNFSSTPTDATHETIQVKDQSFTTATRIHILKSPAHPWSIQLLAPTSAPVQKGDILLATVYLRGEPTPGSPQATAGVLFQHAVDPWEKSLRADFPITNQWQKYDFPFIAKQSLPAGKAQFGFYLGFDPATVDIANISLINFGNKVALVDLPVTHFTYTGREPDAPWRKAALDRIDKIRKADLTITVQDAQGNPIPNASVTVTMTRSAFPFGSAVAASEIFATTPDSQIYRDHILQMFNRVVMENDLKWPQWNRDRAQSLAGVKWLTDHNIEVRGHNLIWPSWGNMPKNIADLKSDPAALRKAIDDHITDEVSALRGQLCEWDVVNEPFDNHDAIDLLGADAMKDWFDRAHAADSNVKLFINDFPIPLGENMHEAHWDAYEKTIHDLIAQGTPLGGIGIQSHFGAIVPPPEQILAGLDRFSKFQKPIEITEFDIDTQDEDLQADYTRDFLTAAFSHPQVNAILMWGFWESHHWIPNAALFRKDWTIKPNGKVWMDLVLKQWRTNESGKTDATGQYKLRAFQGTYQIGVISPTLTKTTTTILGPAPVAITIN